jgi:hypothetical protein
VNVAFAELMVPLNVIAPMLQFVPVNVRVRLGAVPVTARVAWPPDGHGAVPAVSFVVATASVQKFTRLASPSSRTYPTHASQ